MTAILQLRLVPVLLVLAKAVEWGFCDATEHQLVTQLSPVKSLCVCNFLLWCDQNVSATSIRLSKSEPVDTERLHAMLPG